MFKQIIEYFKGVFWTSTNIKVSLNDLTIPNTVKKPKTGREHITNEYVVNLKDTEKSAPKRKLKSKKEKEEFNKGLALDALVTHIACSLNSKFDASLIDKLKPLIEETNDDIGFDINDEKNKEKFDNLVKHVLYAGKEFLSKEDIKLCEKASKFVKRIRELNKNHSSKDKKNDWEISYLSTYQDNISKHNFRACVLKNKSTNEIRIGVAGTDFGNKDDILDDVRLIFGLRPKKIANFDMFIETIPGIKIIFNEKHNIHLAGHSLGGPVSRELALKMNEDGFNVKSSTVFDSPESVYTTNELDKDKCKDINLTGVSSYPNAINSLNKRPKNEDLFFIPPKSDKLISKAHAEKEMSWIYRAIRSVISILPGTRFKKANQHKIEYFRKNIQPQNSTPVFKVEEAKKGYDALGRMYKIPTVSVVYEDDQKKINKMEPAKYGTLGATTKIDGKNFYIADFQTEYTTVKNDPDKTIGKSKKTNKPTTNNSDDKENINLDNKIDKPTKRFKRKLRKTNPFGPKSTVEKPNSKAIELPLSPETGRG